METQSSSDDFEAIWLAHPDLAEIAQQHGRMLEVAIMHGNRAQAIAIVDRAFGMLVAGDIDMEAPLATILSERNATILNRGGVATIGQLCECSRRDLLAIRNVSWRTLKKIILEMDRQGLRLK